MGNDNFAYLTIPDQVGPGPGFVEYIPVDDFFDQVSPASALRLPLPYRPPRCLPARGPLRTRTLAKLHA